MKKVGRLPNLWNPQGFNDHITLRMLRDRNPLLKTACDKIAVKSLVAERVGEEHVVPLLGAWTTAREIPWEELPPAFVLKPSFTSGAHEIATAESSRIELAHRAQYWLESPLPIRHFCEWGYHGINRRVMAEPLLEGPDGGALVEWNVFVFDGRAMLLRALMGRKLTKDRRDAWFDRQGRQLEIRTARIVSKRHAVDAEIRLKLIELAERVAFDFSSMRVDLFQSNSGLMIGELTPYSWSGSLNWPDRRHDRLMGALFQRGADTDALEDYRG